MASGPGWKRPWDSSQTSREPQLTQSQMATVGRRPENPPQPAPDWSHPSHPPPGLTLPPIVTPQYASAAISHPKTPISQQYSPQHPQGHFSRSQPPSPKRQKTSYDQHADSMAYAKWLESTNSASGQLAGARASVPHHHGDFSKPSAPYSRVVESPRQDEFPTSSRGPMAQQDTSASRAPVSSVGVQCGNCGRLQGLTEEIVLGVTMLDRELQASASTAGSGGSSMRAPIVAQSGVKESLEWTAGIIRATIGLARSGRGQPEPQALELHNARMTIDHLRRQMDALEREKGESLSRTQTARSDGPRTPDGSSTISTIGHQRRLSLINDTSSTASSPVRPTSYHQPSMPAPPPRVPNSPTFLAGPNNLTSGQPILTPSAAHLQDLQHRVSTKTIALQTLQQEHDHVLSALSRSQTRCGTLERKFEASDLEINNLTEERIKLTLSLESLENEVETLMAARDEARQQSVANSSQYVKILSMASQLEGKAAAEKRKWKSDHDSWANERTSYETQIARLEKERAEAIDLAVSDSSPSSERAGSEPSDARSPVSLRKASIINAAIVSPPLGAVLPTLTAATTTAPAAANAATTPTSPTSAPRLSHQSSEDSAKSLLATAKDDLLENGTLDQLRDEVVRLRQSCADMEGAVSDLRTEGQRIEQIMRKFGSMGKRVSTKAEQIRSIAAGAKAGSSAMSLPATSSY